MSDQSASAKNLQFHAACIQAAREGNERGVCLPCFEEAWSILGTFDSVTSKYEYGMFIVGYDVSQALDDGGLFDPE